MRLAMCSSWRALQLAAPELRLDRSLVKMAVLQDGLALEAAPPSLRGDRELAFLAVRRNWKAIEFCSEDSSPGEWRASSCAFRGGSLCGVCVSWRVARDDAQQIMRWLQWGFRQKLAWMVTAMCIINY